ncbi:MAG TPA: hypothetical protein VG943_04205 [Caulobacterales bacterium]|nr:hypothetical protein [Caulobacterales bacterium]
MRILASTFLCAFRTRFDELCAAQAGAPPFWTNDTAWTKFMLRDDRSFLKVVSEDWAKSARPSLQHAIECEWLKFDLMVISPGQAASEPWWRSIPILTIEHENGDGIHDEIWKLACWRSLLKVLITYHADDPTLQSKLEVAKQIIGAVEAEYGDDGSEWLFLSAPRSFSGPRAWVANTWSRGAWELLR